MAHTHFSSRALRGALLLFAGTSALSAQAVTLKFLNTSEGRNFKISTNSGASFKSVFSGELRMRELGSPNVDFTGFCATPKVSMSSSNYGTTKTSTASLDSAHQVIGGMVNTYALAIFGLSAGSARKDQAAALQLAIWEVLTETGPTYDLASGVFRAKQTNDNPITGNVLTLANQYLSNPGSGSAIFYQSDLNNQGIEISQSIVTPVPEPATLGALMIGSLTLLRRRNKR